MSSHKDVTLGPNVTQAQFLQFVEEHPIMLAESCDRGTVERKWRLWEEVSRLVNNEGPATKTVGQWKAVWRRKKVGTKKAWLAYRGTVGRVCSFALMS